MLAENRQKPGLASHWVAGSTYPLIMNTKQRAVILWVSITLIQSGYENPETMGQI